MSTKTVMDSEINECSGCDRDDLGWFVNKLEYEMLQVKTHKTSNHKNIIQTDVFGDQRPDV